MKPTSHFALTGLLAFGSLLPLSTTHAVESEERLEKLEQSVALILSKFEMLSSDRSEDLRIAWDSPAQLLEQAKHLISQQKLDEGYSLLQVIHMKHPESEEDFEAFGLARRVFGNRYFRTRYVEATGAWANSRAYDIFQWANSYIEDERFPEIIELTLRGLPYPLYQQYLDFSGRPFDLESTWSIRVTKDNGMIDSVKAAKVEAASETDAEKGETLTDSE